MLGQYIVKELEIENLQMALSLVWRVFLEFEAPDYSVEGIQEFKSFIEYESIKSKIQESQFHMWTCFDNKSLIGVLASRPPCHISLLFIYKQYHRKGIGRALINQMKGYYKTNSDCSEITVNSSPYAVGAYHKLGFKDMNTEQIVNGIRFIPMKRPL